MDPGHITLTRGALKLESGTLPDDTQVAYLSDVDHGGSVELELDDLRWLTIVAGPALLTHRGHPYA